MSLESKACLLQEGENRLKYLGLHEDFFDFSSELSFFRQALQSQLPMLRTYLSPFLQKERKQERFLVLDAGGTNLRCACVEVGPEEEKILFLKKRSLPGTEAEIDADTFFLILAEELQDLLQYSRKLSFCFSFAAEILPNRDARVLQMSKEVQISGMEGRLLGESLREALRKKGDSGTLEVLVLNDTLAALLSVLPEVERLQELGPIGMIHGTGFNTCFPVHKQICELINTESGFYEPQKRGLLDEYLDEASQHPGAMQYEKMVSGVYLGALADEALRDWAGIHSDLHGKPLLSPEFSGRLLEHPCLNNVELSQFSADPIRSELGQMCETEEDRSLVQLLINCLYKRTAKLLSMQIEGLLQTMQEQQEQPCNSDRAVALIVEGTTFHKSTGLREYFEEELQKLGKRNHQEVHCLPCRENSNLYGSALAWQTEKLG